MTAFLISLLAFFGRGLAFIGSALTPLSALRLSLGIPTAVLVAGLHLLIVVGGIWGISHAVRWSIHHHEHIIETRVTAEIAAKLEAAKADATRAEADRQAGIIRAHESRRAAAEQKVSGIETERDDLKEQLRLARLSEPQGKSQAGGNGIPAPRVRILNGEPPAPKSAPAKAKRKAAPEAKVLLDWGRS
jgi:hypothetical protein